LLCSYLLQHSKYGSRIDTDRILSIITDQTA
jgi:hypothetical protein